MSGFGARFEMARAASCAILIALGLLAGGGSAHAQLEVELLTLDPAKDGKDPNPPPRFRAVVVGAIPGLAAAQFVLRQETVEPQVEIKGNRVQTYTESDHKMAMVVLVQGDERWMGNETYLTEDDPDRMEGAFTGIGPALDALGQAGPPGSRAVLLIYSAGRVEVKQPMGDATQLTAASLGSQRDYHGRIGVPLLVGLDESLTVFDQHPGFRRILVIIGDGTGQEEDIGAGLKERIGKLKERRVEVFTIHYDTVPSPAPMGQQNMNRLGYTESKNASSRDNFKAFADRFVEVIRARYYVTFPGCSDTKPPLCFTQDGAVHEFVVKAGDMESDIIDLTTRMWMKPKEKRSLWWLWLLIATVVSGIVIAVIVILRRPEPAPMPVVVMAPPTASPSRTVMINTGSDSGGLPVVGWIVPTVGPNQFQTFKLLHGVTKIGTAPECNIVIQDSFMSSVHAEIASSPSSPSGFVLRDGGSTNGTFVNDRRVSSHDLVDNDVMLMGKTSFKFKSIN